MFNGDRTKIVIEYQLVVERGGKHARTTIDERVVKKALRKEEDVIVAAAVSEYGWLAKNCPEFDELMTPHELKTTVRLCSSGVEILSGI